MNPIIKFVEAEFASRRNDLPKFKAGDTINVHVKIKEGAKRRNKKDGKVQFIMNYKIR